MPHLLDNSRIFARLTDREPDLVFKRMRPTDANVINFVKHLPDSTDYESNKWLEQNTAEVIKRLQKIPDNKIDDKFLDLLADKQPALLAPFLHLAGPDRIKKALKKSADAIGYWPDPDPELVYAALRSGNPRYELRTLEDRFLDERYLPMWQKIIGEDPSYINLFTNPRASLLKSAIEHPLSSQHDLRMMLLLYKPSLPLQIIAVKRYPNLIAEIPNPNLALQMAAVVRDPDSYKRIPPKSRHPAVKAYISTYRKGMKKLG